MKISKLILIPLLLFALIQSVNARIFTSSSGTTMDAELSSFVRDKVTLKKESGRASTIPINLFIEEDQRYIRKWAIDKLVKKGNIFDIKISRKKRNKKSYKKDVTVSGGQVISDGQKVEEYDAFYEYSLKNRTTQNWGNLTIKHGMFIFKDQFGAKDSETGQTKDNIEVHWNTKIDSRKEVLFETKAFPIVETKFTKGIHFTNGASNKSEDELDGIWVGVFLGEKLIEEYSSPKSMDVPPDWREAPRKD